MGHPVLAPDIDEEGWYWCTVDIFLDGSGYDDCRQAYWTTKSGSRKGSTILYWITEHLECTPNAELIYYMEWPPQRLVETDGPYATEQDCEDAH